MTRGRRPAPRVYRLLLRLLPPAFRERFGSEMEILFADRLRAAGRSVPARLGVWCRGVKDVMVHAAAERLPGARPPGRGRSHGGSGERLALDVRHAFRSLRKSPGFAAVAVLTLALGIGANTAVFTVVRSVLLRPLPYLEPDRLMSVWPETNFNTHMVGRIEAEVRALEAVTGTSTWEFTLAGEGEAVRLTGSLVSPHHFSVLGVAPALGRAFRPEEADPDRKDVVILSHGLWRSRFGADPGVLGRTIPLDGGEASARTVVGVMPPGHRPVDGPDVDVWVPLHVDPGLSLAGDDTWYVNRRIGRLAPGATPEEATRELRAVATRLQAEAPSLTNLGEEAVRTASVRPLLEEEVGEVGRALWLLMAGVALVLLIACANVTNLLLARGEARRTELAVRSALGAGRRHLLGQLLAESLLLALVGGVLGLAGAAGGVALLRGLAPPELPRADEIAVDPAVFLFALTVSMTAALASGTAPALRDVGANAAGTLRGGGRSPAARVSGRRLTAALVAFQVALAVVLAFGAGLMGRTLASLYAVDPGFRAEGVLTFRLSPPGGLYGEGTERVTYYDRVLEAVEGVSGIESASAIHLLPGTPSNWAFPIHPEGATVPDDAPTPVANFRVIRPGYFRTMGIPILAGAPVTAASAGEGDTPVMVVNRAFADEWWPDRTPVGREVQLFPPGGIRYRVVGMVGDARQFELDREPVPEVYVSLRQWTRVANMWVVALTRDDPLEHAPAVRRAVLDVDDRVPVTDMNSLESMVRRTAGTRHFVAVLLGAFGGLALLLGAVGVYGVTAWTVSRRVPEFGLRLALGAGAGRVLGSAVARGMVPVALGLVVGATTALAAADVLASLLYGVTGRDPVTVAAVVGVLGLAGLVATGIPAVRAGRLDPARVLRDE